MATYLGKAAGRIGFPFHFGFIPGTVREDGNLLDVIGILKISLSNQLLYESRTRM